ncbi:hypothetical protein AB1Y20_006795 [Prymnesium parvum]|uniref:Uncharacterized protein n=1 Tax=Prymnesium parvum TaxID=97485 RepID=A0AB34J1P5_PRYPA
MSGTALSISTSRLVSTHQMGGARSIAESPSTPFCFSTPSTPPPAPASPIFRRRDSPPPAAASLVLRSTTACPNPVPPLRTIQCPPSHRAHFANGTATVVPIATHPTQPQPTPAYHPSRNPAASARPRPLELGPPQPLRTASLPCAYRSPRRAERAEVHGVVHQPPPDRLTASAALRRRQKATGACVSGGEEG